VNRIKLFNKKTIHEIYNYNLEKHIDFNSKVVRASLTSKEKTLGPDSVYLYVTVSNCVSERMKGDVEKHLFGDIEWAFINHLNVNVGLECLIKKEEIPLEVYNRIKSK